MKDNNFQSGFSRVVITPPLGIDINGYFVERKAEGVLDDLEINTLAVKKDKDTVLLVSIDNCEIVVEILDEYRNAISKRTGVPADAIFLHTTHTHTAGEVSLSEDKLISEYKTFVMNKLIEGATLAIEDLKVTKMGFGVSKAPNIAFVRRYKMKDGSIKTNPGVNNPDIVEPVGQIDDSVNVLRFDRDGAPTIVLASFGCHPDTVGGCKISGDWPAFTRRVFEKVIDDTKCIFFNGVCGDINHVNVRPKAGDFNDMFEDFDGCSRGYGHARHMGRVVAGAIMQVYDKVEYVDVDQIKYLQKRVNIPSNMPKPEDMELAHKYNDLHLAGKDELIPYKEMMLTTVVAEAQRMVKLEHGPEFFPLLFSAIKIGKVAFFGVPGEPFYVVGKEVKKAQGYDMIIPCCLTNGSEGYYPMQDSYDEGGYEARSSYFKAGVAEKIIDIGLEMLKEIQ